PVSSFSVVAASEQRCAALAQSALLQTLSARMLTRIKQRVEPGLAGAPDDMRKPATAPPGVAVVEAGPRGAARVEWLLSRGAAQGLGLDPPVPGPGGA